MEEEKEEVTSVASADVDGGVVEEKKEEGDAPACPSSKSQKASSCSRMAVHVSQPCCAQVPEAGDITNG